MDLEGAVRNVFENITPDDLIPSDINEYREDIKTMIIENIAEWVYTIETDKDWDDATEGEKIGYMERAEGMVESGIVIDADDMKIDMPEEYYTESHEKMIPLAHNDYYEQTEEYTDKVSEKEFSEEYSNSEVLENLGYKEIGDGLYISSDDYDKCINDSSDDKVCAD